MRRNPILQIPLWIACGFFVAMPHLCSAAEDDAGENTPRHAMMNILFLDDAAEGLPAGTTVRYNHWREWDARVPTFQKLLETFIADFQKAEGQQPTTEASMYAFEVSAGLNAAERDRHIADYLMEMAKDTKRSTYVLARSTAGTDQLRLVYVLGVDCPPQEAASFLAALAEVTPPVFHGRVGERFGPFRAPPTIVFDPRADSLSPVPAEQKARHRWGLLEEDAYLLPHYVLHAIASLHESPLTMLADRTLEPGSAVTKCSNYLEQMRQQMELGNTREANTFALKAMGQANIAMNLPGYVDNLNLLSRHDHDSLQYASQRANDIVQQFNEPMRQMEALSWVSPISGALTGYLTNKAQGNLDQINSIAMQIQGHSYKSQTDVDFGGLDDRRYNFDSITLLDRGNSPLTDPALQRFSDCVDHCRESTFPSAIDPKLGGVLFEHDNEYRVDLTGRLAREIAEDRREGRGRGIAMGRIRYFDDSPLLWLDLAAPRDGSLPVGVPRFLTGADADLRAGFGGPWSVEPLTLDVRRSRRDDRRPLRATVAPAETQTRVSYIPFNFVAEDAQPLWIARNGTGFEPYLILSEGGRFVWTLRHEVEIEFDKGGLVDAIRSPHGEHVTYRRAEGRLVGQQTSDGRNIDIQYAGNRPESITLDGTPKVRYDYHADNSLERVLGDRESWSIRYDPRGRPNRIASAGGDTLSFGHDDKGRLTSMESGPTTIGVKYREGTNTLRFSAADSPTVDWLLGPISGPVMEDRAVLLTRSIAGRILQVSKGPVQGTGETRKFKPTETIALVR